MFLESYKMLVTAIATAEEAEEAKYTVDFLEERVQNMPRYISEIAHYMVGVESAGIMMRCGRISIEEYQHRVETLDSLRRSAHDVALDSMNQINRFCDRYGVPHICPDNQDRSLRANFIAAVTMECFMVDHKHTKEDIDKMYELVHSDLHELNVDAAIKAMKEGAKIRKEPLNEL